MAEDDSIAEHVAALFGKGSVVAILATDVLRGREPVSRGAIQGTVRS